MYMLSVLKSAKMCKLTAVMLLVSVFAFILPTMAWARPTDYFPDLPDGYSREDLAVGAPSDEEFYTLQEQLLLMNDIKNRNQLKLSIVRYIQEYQYLHAAGSLAMFDYYSDSVENAANYQAWQNMLLRISRDYEATWQELLHSDNREMVEDLLSPSLLAQLAGETVESDEMLALKSRINGLTEKYWRLIEQDYSVNYQGKVYSFADLADIEDYAVYTAVYTELAKARNAAVAQVLVDVVPSANAYARLNGYDNYADYAYAEVYGRDYTPQQSRQLHALVKQYLVPLQGRVLTVGNFNGKFDDAPLDDKQLFTPESLLDTVAAKLPQISDEYADVLAYMRDKGLADIEMDEGRLSASFTSFMPIYRLAMVFCGTQDGDAGDLTTFVHEFGHFAFYMYEQRDCGYDVGEFHSQGLEMLFMQFADEIFGEAGDAYRLKELTRQMTAVVDGCLYDEFQQKLYQMDNPTVTDANRLFHQLAQEYGYTYMHDHDEAYNWVTTAHTFIQPLYYVSYATSGLSACELLVRSQADFTAAADSYLAMVDMNETAYTAFCDKANFADIFTEDGVRQITDGLEDYFYALCGVDEQMTAQIDGHWAGPQLAYAAALGLLQGDGNGQLNPNQNISRAETFCILWRAYGSAQAEDAHFADVAESAWYQQAANWAAEQQITTGNGYGQFAPAALLSREQLITLLYRLNLLENAEPTVDRNLVLAYADGAAVSDWAFAAFAWALDEGLVQGTDNGLLEPQRAATRAELIALLMKFLDL